MFGFGSFGEFAFGDAESVAATPVFEDSWHQRFNEPTRYRIAPKAAIALIAWSAFVTDPGILTRPEHVSADRFTRQFSEPVRFAPRLPTHAQQFDAWVAWPLDSAERWQPPFSTPTVFPSRLPTHAQQFAALVKSDPFQETVSEDRFHQRFSEPVRFPRAALTAHQRFDALVKGSPFPETVTEDRFHQRFNEPVRFSPRLPTHAQQFSAWVAWPLDSAERWQPPFSTPTVFSARLPAHGQQFSALVQSDPFPETVSEDRFHQRFNEPTRFPRAALTAHQRFDALVQFAPFHETVSEDRFHQRFNEPVHFAPQLPTHAQQFAARVDWPLVSAEKWQPPFSTPTVFPRAALTAHQRFDVLVQFAPFPETVSEDRFHQPFSSPTRFAARLLTAKQQFLNWSEWPIALEEGVSTLTGVAIINAVASSTFTDMLRDPNARLVYKVEIYPWRNSDRADT